MKSLKTSSAIVLANLLCLSACTSPDKPTEATNDSTPFSIRHAKADIEENNKIYADAFARKDSVAISQLYMEDAKFLNADMPPVTGQKAILNLIGGFIRSGATKLSFNTIDVLGCEEMVTEEGTVKVYAGEQLVGDEKYIVIWRKVGVKWKIYRDITNSNVPPAKSN